MQMIKSQLIAVMYILGAAGTATAQTLYIDSCYALAIRNYPLIKQYELIEKTKEYTLSNAGKAWLPQVSVTAIEGYVFGELPKFGATESSSHLKFIGLAQVNQNLWDGGATKTQKKIIEAQSETDRAGVDVAMNDLKSRVNQLYFGILLIDEQLKQLKVQNTILNNNLDRIKKLHDNGLAYSTDLDEIRVEQLKLNQQRVEFNYTRNGYSLMLSLLIGAKIGEQTILQKPVLNTSLADLQIIRPELSLFNKQRNLVNAQSEMQHVNMMPKLGLLGAAVLITPGVNLGNSELSSIGVAGISASWNITALYRNSNEKKLTQLSLNKINVQEETFLFNTRLQMTQASANIEKQKAVLSEDEEIVTLRKAIREGYQEKYNTGVSPMFDFLNATEKETEARAQKAMHEMQLIMTIYDYKTISGN
jgi:outer membrane protein TolC